MAETKEFGDISAAAILTELQKIDSTITTYEKVDGKHRVTWSGSSNFVREIRMFFANQSCCDMNAV